MKKQPIGGCFFMGASKPMFGSIRMMSFENNNNYKN
jgi:hypothetical protein